MKAKKVCSLPELDIPKFSEIRFYKTEEDAPYLDVTHFMSSHNNKFWDEWLDFLCWAERNKEKLCENSDLSERELTITNLENNNLLILAPVGVFFLMKNLDGFFDVYIDIVTDMAIERFVKALMGSGITPKKIVKIVIGKKEDGV